MGGYGGHINGQINYSGQLVGKELIKRIAKNPRYSLRAFARDLEISPAYLSLVLNGKRRLSSKRADKLADHLGLDLKSKEKFIRSAVLISAAKPHTQEVIQNIIDQFDKVENPKESFLDYLSLKLDQFQLIHEWYHLALLELLDCKNHKSDLYWIAHALSITKKQTQQAIERMMRLGLIQIKRGRWVKVHKNIAIIMPQSQQVIREFHRRMIKKSLIEFEKITDQDFHRRSISGMTLAVNPEKIPEAKKKIERFMCEMEAFLNDGEAKEVFQLNLQFFPLTCLKGDH